MLHFLKTGLSCVYKRIYASHKLLFWVVVGALLFVLLHRQYRQYHLEHAPPKPPVSVSFAQVAQKDMTVSLQEVGTVSAYQSADIKPQISGQITKIAFKRGQSVEAGQLMFVIDPYLAQVKLQQALANLAKDQAQWENARRIVKRDAALIRKSFVSQATYDLDKTNAAVQSAVVRADKAAVSEAKIQLAYHYIRAPFSGRAGDVLQDIGNVAAQYSVLTTLKQLTPIDVSFSVPQRYLQRISLAVSHQKPVIIQTTTGKETGSLSFLDNTIDTTTGTVKVMATFKNAKQHLLPGQYVPIFVPIAHLKAAKVVPASSLQQGPLGSYVFLIKPDHHVVYRPVVAGPTVGELTVISQGVNTGDRVVTKGQLQLRDGSRVAPVSLAKRPSE